MKQLQQFRNFLKGAVIGGTMLLPGVSGGTCAIILGIYDRLINSVSEITKGREINKNIIFLLTVLSGGVVGALLFSFVLSAALEMWGFYLSFLFIGAVLGTLPIIVKQSGADSPRWKDLIFVSIGTALSIGITLIPENLLNIEKVSGVGDFLLLLSAGFFISVALILPGISVSYTLLILGIYHRMLLAVKFLDIAYLFPIALGCIIGVFACTRCLDYLMTKYKRNTYMLISGFVLSCVPQIFKGFPELPEIVPCLILFAVGFIAIFFVCKRAESV